MKQYNYHFEIKDIVKQFERAFNDVVVKRYDKNRKEKDQIKVRFTYAPKQRVLMDIVDPQKNYQQTVIAIEIKSIRRDSTRMFNQLLPNSYINTNNKQFGEYKTPMPIDITLEMSMISRNEDDLWQIISNIAPYPNPYIIISWAVPLEYQLPTFHEIRSPVEWDGNINLSMPTNNIDAKSDMLYEATLGFTIKTWLFKPEHITGGIIYKINSDFYAGLDERDYKNSSLSAIQSHEQYDATTINTPLTSYIINNENK